MKYKDIFIDFDDTLYDTRGNAVLALKELFGSMGFREQGVNEEKFYDSYWMTNMDLWSRYAKGEITREYLIIERFRKPLRDAMGTYDNEDESENENVNENKDESDHQNFNANKNENEDCWPSENYCKKISDRFLDLVALQPGTVEGAHELIEYLHGKGYRLHICSNGFHEVQYKKLRACRLYDFFDNVILSEDDGVNKPKPEFFDYALRMSGAQRETTLMIGDNYYSDIVGALDSGIDAMLFQRWDPTFEPPRKVTYIVNTLKEITTIL